MELTAILGFGGRGRPPNPASLAAHPATLVFAKASAHVQSRRAKPRVAATDTLTPIERSERMLLVRSKDTKPELTVRRLVHHLGFQNRLHGKRLPGTLDLVGQSPVR